ncbi:hypothetical protein OESDEN_14509 [Oesophagostomum dentatum]|uniref:Uncharacterized protein n=1 Tax=Oesophagostomum dentatum TaxID=61180 RepID=A0A0B1SQG5_OESDE|nr:hypothetical protein OESDEN_14509 [Oesophagostomum dentatum]
MKLEARFNSDSRFHLDEKFASSGSEDEEEDEGTQERSKNLELLSKVLGSTIKPQKKTVKTTKKETTSDGQPAFRPFTRFDPFNEEHVKWIQKEKASASEGGEKESAEKGNDSSPETEEDKEASTTNGIHYEMQPDFAEELKARLAGEATAEETNEKGTSNGFSFLAMMGRAAPSKAEKTSTNGESKEEEIIPNEKVAKLLGYGGENKGEEEPENISSAKVTAPKLVAAPAIKFFVTGDEPHLQSLVSNFKRTQSLEKIVPRWSNHRDVFAKNYKHLRKAALKEGRRKLLHDNDQADSKRIDRKGRSFPKKRKAEEMQ